MLTARHAAIRLLKLMMVASLVLPAMLFAFAGWSSYRNIKHVTDDRIDRSLDILHEHALKVLQTLQRTVAEIDEITRGMSDDYIRANEGMLHARLKEIVNALPQLQGITIIDRDGHPLVSADMLPVPKDVSFAGRDFFRAQVAHDAGTYISRVHYPLTSGIDTYFFSVSQRRPALEGKFNGIISVAILPAYFNGFYSRMASSDGSYFALARNDGRFLARYPILKNPLVALPPDTDLRERIANNGARGLFTVKSQVDNTERRVGYRKLTGFPLYVLAGENTSAITHEWLSLMSSHLIFGLPATALIFALLGLALRRTTRLYDEADRREAAEGALRQAQRLEAIGQLTGGVAHDFNNLLMIISGGVQRLRSDFTDEKQTRLLDMIATAIERGETLTRQLLTYSRRQMLSPQVIDLTQHMPLIRELLTRSLHGGIAINVDVPMEPCAVRVDISEFELAILNLAVNAKDAMSDGGKLTIRIKPVTLRGEATDEGLSGEFVAVRVADTGHGIPTHVLTRVFEPFFTTKEFGKGTGLGLSQVYGFAKQSGGTATVSSIEGRGTTVTLYLPRTHDKAEAVVAKPPGVAPAKATGTVLLVEDNGDVADVAAGLLHDLGYRVRSVASAHDAISALRLDPEVDLVFSDILMPGGKNGLDLADEIRARYPDIPVLLTTGYSASAQDAVARGVVVLQKPYDLEALRRHIREAVERAEVRGPQVAPVD